MQIEFEGDIMATMIIRGLDDQALARLKNQAEQEGSSLNSLVLRLLQGTGTSIQPGALKKFDDLDALAGTWSDEEAQAFERNTAAFSEVDS
ncbi:MAG: antitoxin [Hydrogenophilales bacterium]|nr:antitoxin [Hydrogenophilales bacterium]